ncbi:DNA-directed RNA polymerase subunit beta [Paenibacillus sp. N4]|uniref:DNA-directed RNA polymerase subunit beta n=1 Tax=Paenibacillus vietnamensis TaxID=2590547 RepID=UPI001CD0E3F2|nr:DNA-directed RNA polymerase subunit beta [Paenibacillus vietnamensis]MCA0757515.1 DNA-directed RNA polymerase subunit beta [Paenibacillus vietnamensis]
MSMADERIDREEIGGIGSQPEESGTGSRKRVVRAKAEGSSKQKQRPKWANVLLWILRRSIVPLIMIIMLIAGLYAGYVVIGHGPTGDVFSWSTWRHLYDLIFAES